MLNNRNLFFWSLQNLICACFELPGVAGGPQHPLACSCLSDFCFSLHVADLPDFVPESPPRPVRAPASVVMDCHIV